MGRPAMTEEQRVLAVVLLANAIRKDQYLQARAEAVKGRGDLFPAVGAQGRGRSSQSYLQGMRDLLAILFDGGRATADACFAEASHRAGAGQAPMPDGRTP